VTRGFKWLAGAVVVVAAIALFSDLDGLFSAAPSRPDPEAGGPVESPSAPVDVASAPPREPRLDLDTNDAAEPPPRRILYLHDIDDIKHEIYAREIESVDRLHLLDDLIQTGDMDTRELWDSDWSGVDDWKEEANGFSLQRIDENVLIFHPGPETMQLYSYFEEIVPYEYDPETHEFVNEVDYYGKPIRNVLKFIKDDTLVMMTISGEKVDLNIYDKGGDDD
jgi:hypothetical protein